GYVRLLLLVIAFGSLNWSPVFFLVAYTTSIILDGLDGYTARKFGQCSYFGAWFDVVQDNISRGLLWAHLHPLLSLISALEWMTFTCTHTLGAEWRSTLIEKPPSVQKPPVVVAKVLQNNFRSLFGIWAISGLHVLPIWLFGMQYEIFSQYLIFVPEFIPYLGVIILVSGRLLCGLCEAWCCWTHIQELLVNTTHVKCRVQKVNN
ncbi:unnamed protein product, partial [Meganyctiphanes norvegica]